LSPSHLSSSLRALQTQFKAVVGDEEQMQRVSLQNLKSALVYSARKDLHPIERSSATNIDEKLSAQLALFHYERPEFVRSARLVSANCLTDDKEPQILVVMAADEGID
jgi:hypothetical protein